ncbi:uncharacterized protein LOC136764133 [Amia ocellicauda]|uniref:uncharacterized protein LOC136764133 n=1 Tax=Amia ocellicauda TaxID=2972642 RepID=UPI0034647260
MKLLVTLLICAQMYIPGSQRISAGGILDVAVKLYDIVKKSQVLMCEHCTEGKDCKPQHCTSTELVCAASTISAHGKTSQEKGCALMESCGRVSSVHLGYHGRKIFSVKCCNIEKCNPVNEPEPPNKATTNNHECFTCDTEVCNTTLKCQGEEDHCFKTTVFEKGKTVAAKGCVTSNLCAERSSTIVGRALAMDLNCCKGNLCNNAKRAGQSIFLLLASLSPIALFL